MKEKVRELGLAGLGLAVTVKEKAHSLGRKLVRKGQANEKRILSQPRQKFVAGAHVAGKEALVISRKSLQMLERELKKLEAQAKKVKKGVKARKKTKSKAKKRL